jgi:rhodanese-related sulfurtransferase
MKHIKKILIILAGIIILITSGLYLYIKNINYCGTGLDMEKSTAKQEAYGKIISWDEFKNKSREKNNIVIDLRKPEEIAQGKLFKNALELNYFSDDYRQKVSELDKDKTYLLYCQLGGRTVKSLDIFYENGLDAYCLDGGVDATQIKEDLEKEKHLSWEEFQKKSQDENTVVIDIRTKDEYEAGKLFEDAIVGFDYYSSTFEQKIAQLDSTKTYLIYCRSGNRTGKSIPIFEKYGLEVYDLAGGHKATPAGSLK